MDLTYSLDIQPGFGACRVHCTLTTTSGRHVTDISQPPVLMNRFMLNLRQLGTNASSESQSYSAANLHFRASPSDPDRGALINIIGNIGEPLVHGEDDEGRGYY